MITCLQLSKKRKTIFLFLPNFSISEQLQKKLSQHQLKYILKKTLGYEWHRVKKHNAARFTPNLKSWIHNFIARKERNRVSNDPLLEVYIDESYVNEHHSANFSWFPPAESNNPYLTGAPSGKGRRIIMIDAGSIFGWVVNTEWHWYNLIELLNLII